MRQEVEVVSEETVTCDHRDHRFVLQASAHEAAVHKVPRLSAAAAAVYPHSSDDLHGGGTHQAARPRLLLPFLLLLCCLGLLAELGRGSHQVR